MADINKILNGEGGLSVRDKLNEVIDKVNASAVVVPVGDAPVFDPAKADGYQAGSIISYRNEASPDTQFQTFAIYVANSDIPVGVSPEDSAEWLFKGTEYIIQSGSTSTIYVRDIDGLRELQDMKTGESVIVQNEYAVYTFFANLETGIKPYIPGVGSWVKRKEISLSNLVYVFDSETAGNDIGLQIPVGGVILFFHNAGGFRWLDNEGATLHSIALTEPSIISRTGAGLTLGDLTILPIFGGISWLELTDRPAWLSPASLALFEAAHGHDWSLIANKPATATRWPSWAEVTSKPATFTPEAHDQAISTITGLQAALDNKAAKAGDGAQDFNVKDLFIHGQVNQWLAQQLVVDDARIQVNRRQNGVLVDSGLVIYDKDAQVEVSTLVYDTNELWRAGGQRIFTDNYNPTLGGYSAASYPRKAENAVITGNWGFLNLNDSLLSNVVHIKNSYNNYDVNGSITYPVLTLTREGKLGEAYENRVNFSIGRYTASDGAWARTQLDIKLSHTISNGEGATVLTALSNGNIGFGVFPTERLHVAGNGLFTGDITAQNITLSGNLTSNSDIRKKENLKSIDNVLDKVLILKPTKYNFKDDESKRERIGLIAQELQKEFPQFVEEDDTENKYLSVDYAGISVIAIKAIQELNDKLMSQIKELEDKIDGLCN